MRVEKELTFQGMKVTLFHWNNKFLLKFEMGGMEQTYKFSEFEFNAEEVEGFITDPFVKRVSEIFSEMNKNLDTVVK